MPQPILSGKKIIPLTLDIINNNAYIEITNSKNCSTVSFVPMISPIYTSPFLLEKYINEYFPIALKIHFKNDLSYPEMISEQWIKILKKYDIPLIVHTDYSQNNQTDLGRLKNLNSALNWYNFFKKTGLKGYLTHGARLNSTVLEEINSTDNVVIGIGPDLMLKNYCNSLESDKEYLETLYNYVNPNKLLFDLDFNWNITENYDFDFNAINRMKTLWNHDELIKILGINSLNFFKLEKTIKKRVS